MNLKVDLFLQDLKFALRSLSRAKGLVITVVLTLALGIGANAAIFSLVRGVLLRPLVNARRGPPHLHSPERTQHSASKTLISRCRRSRTSRPASTRSSKFGDFSIVGFTMIGLGEPREVRAGVVGGTYFEVMGLHPVLGRLIGPQDDGPKVPGVVVLTYRYWSTALKSDPSVLGKIASPRQRWHGRSHRHHHRRPRTLCPLSCGYGNHRQHRDESSPPLRHHGYRPRSSHDRTLRSSRSGRNSRAGSRRASHCVRFDGQPISGRLLEDGSSQINAVLLRDQITSGARTVLLVLLAASGLVFIIACSNVANLILARTVRREGELAIRAALGASTSALAPDVARGESDSLCGRRYIGRSHRASAPGCARALCLPLFRPRPRPYRGFQHALGRRRSGGHRRRPAGLRAAPARTPTPRKPPASPAAALRITGSTGRRLRLFAITQIAASFMLLAGASMLLKTLLAMQAAQTGLDTRHVLAINVPAISYGKTPLQIVDFYKESMRRIEALPGVNKTAFGLVVPWRDAGSFGPGFAFSADLHVKGPGEEDPRAQLRTISPGFFAALGVPIIAGRDFNELDGKDAKDPVVIVSETLAKRMFPNQDAVNRHVYWTDPVIKFVPGISTAPHRIIGVTADIDDEHIVPGPILTVYSPIDEGPIFGGRLFIHTTANPYSLVTPVTRIIRDMSADQPVERASTLEDVRAEVLTPDRLNTVVFGVFAGVALAIALVGVAGVLAFSVSARTREFGIRLALGSPPRRLLAGVIVEGAIMAIAGVVAGAAGGYLLARFAGSYFLDVRMPSATPVIASALILLTAAVVASALPAARAARINVMEALRSD